MKYAVVTMGGTVIETGLTEDQAEKLKDTKNQETNSFYYHVEKSEVAEKIEENLKIDAAKKLEVERSKLEEEQQKENPELEKEIKKIKMAKKETEKFAPIRWNEVINEGEDGYQSDNW